MPLSKAQRAKLAAQGFSKKDLADIDANLDDDEGAEDEPGRRTKRRVFVLEGAEADSFLDRIMGGGSDDEEDDSNGDGRTKRKRKAKAEDDDEDEDEDDGDADEKPPAGSRYFR